MLNYENMTEKITWQSAATNTALKQRSGFLREIRSFFESRGVCEVDTPVLMQGVNTDPFINAFNIADRYLQTSPEFAMKRLLAQGVGPIYYLGKAFRNEEMGRYHNPEFTMLEWYRPGWDHQTLIEELNALVMQLLDAPKAQVRTYAQLFEDIGVNPHQAEVANLKEVAMRLQIAHPPFSDLDRNGWLDWLFVEAIEPNMDPEEFLIVTDFPVHCAQLAKLIPHPIHDKVAARFEVFYKGMELANGYFELTDPNEQRKRFVEDNQKRHAHQLPAMPVDEKLLAALAAGIGDVSGVAVGVDRLLMIKLGATHIKEVLPFYWEFS